MTKKRYPLGLMLPDDLNHKVETAATAMGVSKSGFVRYVLIKEFAKDAYRLQSMETREPSEISLRFVAEDS